MSPQTGRNSHTECDCLQFSLGDECAVCVCGGSYYLVDCCQAREQREEPLAVDVLRRQRGRAEVTVQKCTFRLHLCHRIMRAVSYIMSALLQYVRLHSTVGHAFGQDCTCLHTGSHPT